MKLHIILWPLMIFLLSSCFSKGDNVVNSNPYQNPTPTPSPTVSPTPTPTPRPTDDYGKVAPFSLNNIITHGGVSSTVVWTSTTSRDPAFSDTNIFKTDSMMKFRMRAKSSPGQGVDSQGVACTGYFMDYQKLKIRIRVRDAQSGSYSNSITLEATNGQWSSPQSVTNLPRTDSYFIVEVYWPMWDWYCQHPGYNGPCPWAEVFPRDCIEFDLQMATDYTYDF